jgi:hypothetical protein
MQQITFEHIHKSGQVVLNNELFKHFHFQEVCIMETLSNSKGFQH